MFWTLTSTMCCNDTDNSLLWFRNQWTQPLPSNSFPPALQWPMQHWCSDSLTKIHQQHYQIMHLLITIPDCKRQAKNKGTNWDPEQKPFLHSLQWVTEDEAKTCRVFTRAYRDGTAAPSDNPGQVKWGGTAARVGMPYDWSCISLKCSFC